MLIDLQKKDGEIEAAGSVQNDIQGNVAGVAAGADGVMVGRGALGRPWIFKQIAHYLKTGEKLPDPPRAERAKIALHYAELNYGYAAIPEKAVCLQMRKQLSKYALDDDGSVLIRNQLVRVESMDDIRAILKPIIAKA